MLSGRILVVGILLFLESVIAGLTTAHAQNIDPKVIQQTVRSVVSIRGEKTVRLELAGEAGKNAGRLVRGMGSGVIIDPRGYIVTCYHLVDGVRDIQVTLSNGKKHTATLTAHDAATDLAVIKIDVDEKLPAIPIGNSANLVPVQSVLAIGNAFGYENTITRGIISALHRAVQVSDAQFYDDLIQTDASINPGSAGGPLLNTDGEMIGLNVAVRAGAQGIGFALPINKVMSEAATLLGSAAKSWHGVVAAPDASAAPSGMKVASVEKTSPAAESGLQVGDVITAVGDMGIRRALDFQGALLDRKAGDKVELTVRREGKALKMDLHLAERREVRRPQIGVAELPQPQVNPAWEMLGLELKPIAAAKFQEQFNKTKYHGGLLVVDVRADSPAAAQRIRPGDVLVGLHVWETVSLANVSYVLTKPDLGTMNPLKFYILRGDQTLYGYLPVNATDAKKTAE